MFALIFNCFKIKNHFSIKTKKSNYNLWKKSTTLLKIQTFPNFKGLVYAFPEGYSFISMLIQLKKRAFQFLLKSKMGGIKICAKCNQIQLASSVDCFHLMLGTCFHLMLGTGFHLMLGIGFPQTSNFASSLLVGTISCQNLPARPTTLFFAPNISF